MRLPPMDREEGTKNCCGSCELRSLCIEPYRDRGRHSGYPYHPWLFNNNVRPGDWDRFTRQITRTELSHTASLGGFIRTDVIRSIARIVTSYYRKLDAEEDVRPTKELATEASRTACRELQGVLQQWNDNYFHRRGICVRLESHTAPTVLAMQDVAIWKRTSTKFNTSSNLKKRARFSVIIVSEASGVAADAEACIWEIQSHCLT